MGRTKHYEPGDETATRWAEYVGDWLDANGQTNADLARATGLGESQVSRWRRGATVPDVVSCRKVAKALGRPVLEVMVAAGHLTPAEANNTKPVLPPKADARLVRLQSVLNDPKTPKATRDRLQMLIDMATETADSAPKSGRSSA